VTSRTRRLNRTEKREANRARILLAARTVFGRQGFHAATIEQIADEAGLSNGAIYYNFASKGELFFALLEERTHERLGDMRRALGRGGGARSAEQEARAITRAMRESREWRLLTLEFVAHAARTPSLADKLQALRASYRDGVAEVLEQRMGAAQGDPPIAPDELALVASALAEGLAVEELAAPGSVRDGLLGEVLAKLAAPPLT
jgi:AcrR family transcriptional regulator